MMSVNNVQLASLNDKRYYFLDRIVSLPFEHPLLSDLRELKTSYPNFTEYLFTTNNLLYIETQY